MNEIESTYSAREVGCAFCEIIEGFKEGFLFEQTDNIAVLLSLEGHPLIVSRTHLRWPQLDEQTALEFGKTMVKYMTIVEKSLKADGVNVFVTKGRAAGQELPHAHMHIIPRWYNDKLGGFPQNHSTRPLEERVQIFEKIKARLERDQINVRV